MVDSRFLLLPAMALGLSANTNPVTELPLHPEPVELIEPSAERVVIPRMTLLFVEMLEEVSSETATSGDRFRIKLVTPITVGDRVVVPAGVEGEGEVVHAKRRGQGSGGELILAARFLDYGGQQIPLRSMQIVAQGNDEDGKVQMVTAAVGVFGLMVKGRDTVISSGRVAQAKVAADFEVLSVDLEASEIARTEDHSEHELEEIGGSEPEGPADDEGVI